jgi:hypothetical protein
MSGLPDHLACKHPIWDPNWIVSAARGFRNGIIIGAESSYQLKFDQHFFLQALGLACRTCSRQLHTFFSTLMTGNLHSGHSQANDTSSLKDRLRSVVKMMFVHGYNLGSFVVIYKTICAALRSVNINGGIESLIAGFIGIYRVLIA